jgi:protein subunit release factor A
MSEKKLILSLTKSDFEFETFRVGGCGGGRLNSTSVGCRYRHRPSGAVGEGREERMQSQNKKAAFEHMANSPEMAHWLKAETSRRLGNVEQESIEDMKRRVDGSLKPEDIKVEVLNELGEWVVIQ